MLSTYTDRYKCYFCGLKCEPKNSSCRNLIEIHHIQEKCEKGTNHISNLVPVCSNHHSLIHMGKIKNLKWFMSTRGMLLKWEDENGNSKYGP